ncbi:MAG TPA: hypothetical protein PL033_06725 [Candidatus Brocadiia bacterium]|nr:hypothetical protein [Candidatus Brocadiia bacterium]
MPRYGSESPPESVEIFGKSYTFIEFLKRDGYSVNMLLEETLPGGGARKWVLKNSRVSWIGIPFNFLARWLSRREYAFYCDLQGLPFVPELGPRPDDFTFLHEFVEGVPLSQTRRQKVPVSAEFFAELLGAFYSLHERGYAYVDTAKKDNVIVGQNGKPYLIDFQITLGPKPWGGLPGWAYGKLVRHMQREDLYHYYKHKKRRCPEIWTDEDERNFRRGRLNAIHGVIRRPYLVVKRFFWPKERYKQ